MAENETPNETTVDTNTTEKKSVSPNPEDGSAKKPPAKKRAAPKKKAASKKKAAPKKKATPKRKPAPKKATSPSAAKPAMKQGGELEKSGATITDTSKTEITAAQEPHRSDSADRGSAQRSKVWPWISLVVLIAVATYLLTGPLNVRKQNIDSSSSSPIVQTEELNPPPPTDASRHTDESSTEQSGEAQALARGQSTSTLVESQAQDVTSQHSDRVEQSQMPAYPSALSEPQTQSEYSAEKPVTELATTGSSTDQSASDSSEPSTAETDAPMSEVSAAMDTANSQTLENPEAESVSTADSAAPNQSRGNEPTALPDPSAASISETVETAEVTPSQVQDTQSAAQSEVSEATTSQGQTRPAETGKTSAGEAETALTAQTTESEPQEPETDTSATSTKVSPATQGGAVPSMRSPWTYFGQPYRSWYPKQRIRSYPQHRRHYSPHHYYPYQYRWRSPYSYRATPSHKADRSYRNQ